jgi:hypothetical protein
MSEYIPGVIDIAKRIAELEKDNSRMKKGLQEIANSKEILGWSPAAHIAEQALQEAEG